MGIADRFLKSLEKSNKERNKNQLIRIVDEIFSADVYPRKMTSHLKRIKEIFDDEGYKSEWLEDNLPEDED